MSVDKRISWRFGFVWITTGAIVLLPGCGGGVPKTYPVKGKVVFKGKGNINLLKGAFVQFQAVSDSSLLAAGEIEDDYTFTLGTFNKGKKGLPGAVEGIHRARIAFATEIDEENEKPGRGIVHPRFLDFNKSGLQYTVIPGNDNHFTVEVSLN